MFYDYELLQDQNHSFQIWFPTTNVYNEKDFVYNTMWTHNDK